VYFNRKSSARDLCRAAGTGAESRRPILISVVALFSLIGDSPVSWRHFCPFPEHSRVHSAWLGETGGLLNLCALLIAAGVGLWRLEEWGRRLALVLQLSWLAQNIVLIARPSLITKTARRLARP